VIDRICEDCRSLLSSGARSSHHTSISRLNNSELIKCNQCEAFVLFEQDTIELMQVHAPSFPGNSQSEHRSSDRPLFAFR